MSPETGGSSFFCSGILVPSLSPKLLAHSSD